LYENNIEYAIIEETIDKVTIKQILDDFVKKNKDMPSVDFLRDAVYTCKKSRSQTIEEVKEIEVQGLPNSFS
jgi:hypothetical protein